MLNMPFVIHDPPSAVEKEMLKFVNANIAGMIVFQIDLLEANDDYDMACYFPARMFRKNREKCVDALYELYDTINSSVVYYKLLPLHNYLLYQIIDGYIDDYKALPDDYGFSIPEVLKKRIIENYIPEAIKEYPKETEEELIESLFDSLENPSVYIELCFDDTDFLDYDLRHYVQLAIYSPGIFRCMMNYEELDQLIDVMPGDVAEQYKAFRREMDREKRMDPEGAIINILISALESFHKRIVHHCDEDEVKLTAELEEKIELTLADIYGIHMKREYNIGRSIKRLGETDLYFYKIENGLIRDLAILENKEIDRFREQYYQLIGYLNPSFLFGITISINRNHSLSNARKIIIEELKGLEGDYAVESISASDRFPFYLMSEHIVPETGEMMSVHHLILNLEDESRQVAARIARHQE